MSDGSAPPLGWQPYTFSIVGVQKSGTSTLSVLLNAHPAVRKAPRKEIHHFDDESRDWSDPTHPDYCAPRRAAGQVHMGDATPRYLVWPRALERMRDHNPRMLVVSIFRDPLDRLFSHWMMNRLRHGEQGQDWPEFISHRPGTLPDRLPEDGRGRPDPQLFQRTSGVLRGYYGSQVERGLSLFPREQWLFLDFASFLEDYRAHLDRAADFLGVGPYPQHPPLRKLMAGAERVSGSAPTGEQLVGLAEHYREEIDRYSRLTELPVGHWTTSRLLAGELDPDEQAHRYALKAGLAP